MFTVLERSDETLADVLARTEHLTVDEWGPVACDHCGDHRSIGRREGDPKFQCLPGYGCNR